MIRDKTTIFERIDKNNINLKKDDIINIQKIFDILPQLNF